MGIPELIALYAQSDQWTVNSFSEQSEVLVAAHHEPRHVTLTTIHYSRLDAERRF